MHWSCVCGARGRSGGSGLVPVLASPLGLLPLLASLAVRVAGCPAPVSLPFNCRYAIPCGRCVPRARSGCPSGPRGVSLACVCAHPPAAFAPPPPRRGRCAACTTFGSASSTMAPPASRDSLSPMHVGVALPTQMRPLPYTGLLRSAVMHPRVTAGVGGGTTPGFSQILHPGPSIIHASFPSFRFASISVTG